MPQALAVKYTTGAAGSCRGAKGGGATGSTATSVVVAVCGGFGAVAPSSSSSVGSATFSAGSPTESDRELVCGQAQDATDLALWIKQLMNDVCDLTWKISSAQCDSAAVAMSGGVSFLEAS